MGHLPASLYVFGVLALCASVTRAQCPDPVWADEFGGRELDQTKWSHQQGDGCAVGICGWGNDEEQYYVPGNTTVGGGILRITARKQLVEGKKYTSSRLSTRNKGDWTYGRFVARIRVPAGRGLWPAFWMLPTEDRYGGWPQSGEIDIVEYTGQSPDQVLGTIHFGGLWPGNRSRGTRYFLTSGSFSDTFHEFAVDWSPREIRWSVDGALYHTVTAEQIEPHAWPFNKNFHLIMNLAVGGTLGGAVDDAVFPATLEVDHVRVYARPSPYIDGNLAVGEHASGETYRIDGGAGESFVWTVPAGASIASGQGSNSITVNWGDATSSGRVGCVVEGPCGPESYAAHITVRGEPDDWANFENFESPGTVVANDRTTGVLTEVSNPDTTGINASDVSGRYIRNLAEYWDTLFYEVDSIGDASEYGQMRRTFSMDVYTAAPAGTLILIQLEDDRAANRGNFPVGRHSRYEARTSTRLRWERLEFVLKDAPDPSVPHDAIDNIVILFAPGSRTGHTFYFDNFASHATFARWAPMPTK